MSNQQDLDELFEIKNAFYIGNYHFCINEAQKLKPSTKELQIERDVFLYRALIGQRKYGVVINEVKTASPPPLQALKLLSKYFQSQPNQRISIVNDLEQELSGSVDLENISLLIVAATVYSHEENYEAALRVLNQSDSLECRALMIQCYLKMERLDAAKKELKNLQEKDDDATLTQLAQAWTHIATGGEKLQDAYYIYQELIDKNCSTPVLLNRQATCFLGQEKYEEAESALQEALDKDPNNPNTLINLMVLAHRTSKPLDLCLHFATLDNSITWSRSAVVNKRCRVCRRTSDSENIMLLCDGCDAGYHMYCLKPKLKSVPSGDWFCNKCKPKIKAKSHRKQIIVYQEEEEEPEFVNLEYCYTCKMGGELVLCDTCPKSLHLECADLKKIPKGNWSCPFCLESKENTNSKRKSNSGKSSNSKSSNKRLKTDEEIEEVLRRSSRSRFDVENENRRGKNSKKSLEEIEQRGRNGKRSSKKMEQGEIFNQQAIEKIIHQLMSHHDSGPFRKSVYRQEAPDYYEKIKKPIDLRTIKMRFNKNKYETDAEFIADVLLIFQNTQQYFEEGSLEYKAGLKISKFFLKQVRNSNLHSAGLIENEYEPPRKKKRKS